MLVQQPKLFSILLGLPIHICNEHGQIMSVCTLKLWVDMRCDVHYRPPPPSPPSAPATPTPPSVHNGLVLDHCLVWDVMLHNLTQIHEHSHRCFKTLLQRIYLFMFQIRFELSGQRVYTPLEVCLSHVLVGSAWWRSFWLCPMDQVCES